MPSDGMAHDGVAGCRSQFPSTLLAVELWYSPFYGIYNGAMVPFVIDAMPQKIRTTGFALSYSLATALFGGFTPAIATYLIHVTGSKAAPTLWLSFAAALSLTAALLTDAGTHCA